MTDKILINANIHTMDQEKPIAQALAIGGGIILEVGSNEEILKFKDEMTEVIDACGKMVLPGFIDAHCHPSLCAFLAGGIEIQEDMDVEEVLETVRRGVSTDPDADTYVGIGYNECLFDEKGPNKELLDEICRDKPLFLLGSSAHVGWCNSKTLELAGVTRDTPDPLPGFQYFQRDEEGEPTGHVVECAAEGILFKAVAFFKEEDLCDGYLGVSESYSSMGVTSLADCGSFDWMEELGLPILDRLVAEGKFKQRLFGCVMVDTADKKNSALELLKGRSKKYSSDRYRVNTYKIILDGTMETRTASLLEPYNEDGRLVEPLFSGKEIEEVFVAAAKEGFDIHSHGIGDKAIRENLRGAAAVREAGFSDTRITNAHTDCVRKEDRPLFAKYHVIANTTGVWHYGNDDMDKIIGKERADQQFTIKDIIKEGGKLTLGSDRPVDEYGPEPLRSIEVAMTRKLIEKEGAPVLPPEDQKLSLQECLEGYTCNAAWQLNMEDKLGQLTRGAYADLVLLGRNLYDMEPEDIHNVPVEMTICGGEIIFTAE